MSSHLIKKVKLDNGLELELYDASKKVAGDRWLVKVVGRINVPVRNYLDDMPSGIEPNDLTKIVGENVVFEKTTERNFVDNTEKETILNGFLGSFLENLFPYFSGSNFPKQFIAKKYKEAKSRTGWYQDERL